VRAVDGISFALERGRTLAIVGESGSGKSTTLQQILELAAPQAGSIEVLGEDVAALTRERRRALRRDIQVVFQDPVASLDPRLPVSEVIAEPLQANGFRKGDTDARGRTLQLCHCRPAPLCKSTRRTPTTPSFISSE